MHLFRGGPSAISNRPTWTHRADFLFILFGTQNIIALTSTSFITCIQGGLTSLAFVFLIMCFYSLPATFLEIGLGQLTGRSAIEVWEMVCPALKGIGYVWLIVKFFMSCTLAQLLGKTFIYLASSFRYPLPWNTCDQSWNTLECSNNYKPPQTLSSTEFMQYRVMKSGNFNNSMAVKISGSFNWELSLGAIIAWILCIGVLMFGIRVVAKIMYVLVGLTVILSLILLVRVATLPGSMLGMKYFLWPRIYGGIPNIEIGIVEFLFSLFSGSLITFSSYNGFKYKFIKDCLAVHVFFFVQIIIMGLIVYMSMGFLVFMSGESMSCRLSIDTRNEFYVSVALSLSKTGTSFFCVVLFLMLFTFMFSFLVTNTEVIVTCLLDVWGSHVTRARVVISSVVGILGIVLTSLSCFPTSFRLFDGILNIGVIMGVATVFCILACVFHFGSCRLATFIGLMHDWCIWVNYFRWTWRIMPLFVIIGSVSQLFYASIFNIFPVIIWLIFLIIQIAREKGSIKTRFLALVRPRWHVQQTERFDWKESWAPLDRDSVETSV